MIGLQHSILVSAILLSSLLIACSTGAIKSNDQSLPNDGLPQNHQFDITSISNAVPKHEPLSQTGNKVYQVFGKIYTPLKSSHGYQAKGIASWYGTKFHGKKTSSGEAYNMYAMSAAHRTLPLPSYVRVTNLTNQRSVIVKVNDRGPFINPKRRIIDLSYVAAAKLGMVATGTAPVLIQSISQVETITTSNSDRMDLTSTIENENSAKKDSSSNSQVLLQMGAFSSRKNATIVLKQLMGIDIVAYIEQVAGLFKVRSGPYADASKALSLKNDIQRALNIDANVVIESLANN